MRIIRVRKPILVSVSLIIFIAVLTLVIRIAAIPKTNVDMINYLVKKNFWTRVKVVEEKQNPDSSTRVYTVNIKDEKVYVHLYKYRETMDLELPELGRMPGKSSITYNKGRVAAVYYGDNKRILMQLDEFFK